MLSKQVTTVRVVNIEAGQRRDDLQRLFGNHGLRPLGNGSFCPSSTAGDSSYVATVSFVSKGEAKEALQLNGKVLGNSRIGVDSEFYGLTVLGAPSESQKPTLDVIALHGLNGHGYATWNYLDPDGDRGGSMWLRDYLPAQLPYARIMTFGYNSVLLGSRRSVSEVKDFARDLLQRLVDDRISDEDRKKPIIFICHSLGGIVVKQALVMAHREPDMYDSITEAVASIIFLATPHSGSKTADIGSVACSIAYLAFKTPAKPLLKALKSHSSMLSQLADDFRNLRLNLTVVSFYERQKTPHINALVVDEQSSMIGLAGERLIPMDASHRDICKFSGAADPLFAVVLAQITKCASFAVSRSKTILRDQSGGVSSQSTSTMKSPRQHFIVPFDPNPQFYGRTSELKMIDELLTASDNTENPVYPVVAIYGLGGVGKTQLVAKYAYNRKEKEPGKSVFWLSADSEDSLESQFTQIAHILGEALKPQKRTEHVGGKKKRRFSKTKLTLTSSASRTSQPLDILAVNRVKEWMATPGNEDWLLVLDNFDDIKTNIRRFLPVSARGGVVITTRDRRLVGSIANAGLELREMSLEDSERLFYRLCFSANDVPNDPKAHPEYPAIKSIVKELYYFPLALHQAASFVRENAPMSFQEYLDFLTPRTEDRELLLRFKEANPKYPESIMTTWEISFRRIEHLNPRASKILQLLGFLDFSQISESLLNSSTKPLKWEFGHLTSKSRRPPYSDIDLSFLENNANFRLAIGILTSFALIDRTLGGLRGTSLNVHPLVHEWTRVRLNSQPDTQAKYAIMASLVLYQTFPFEAIVKISKPTVQGSPISSGFRSRLLQVFPHVESVILNLTEYSKNSVEIPPECSAFLAAVFLALSYELPPDMRTLGPRGLDGLCQALQEIASRTSEYHHFHAVFALTVNWLHHPGNTEKWLSNTKSVNYHLNTSDMTKAVDNTQSGVMVVLTACTLKYAQESVLIAERIESSNDLQCGEDVTTVRSVLVGLRNTLDLQPSESAFDRALKFYLEYHFVRLLPPNDYWRLSDRFLTDTLSKSAVQPLDTLDKCVYLCICAKLHWERDPAKDFYAIVSTYLLAYDVATEGLESDRANRESIWGSDIREGIQSWSPSGDIPGVSSLGEGTSIHVSSSARKFWGKSLSYFWDTWLSVVQSFAMPGVQWVINTGTSKVTRTLTLDERRSYSLDFLRRFTGCIRNLNLSGTTGLVSLTPPSIQSSLVSVYVSIIEYHRALELLEPLLKISWIRNHYETERRKPWDAYDASYFSTKKDFITALENSGVSVKRKIVSQIVPLLYPDTLHIPAATVYDRGEQNSNNDSEKHREISQWWNKIERSTHRMVLDYLGRYRQQGASSSENDAKSKKYEKASRKFVQEFTSINVDEGENPISSVLYSSNSINTEIEIVLEDNTNNLVDKTLTCLSALSIIPSATANFMHTKLNLINTSNLELARRLGKLSLLYDIGGLHFFRNGWVRKEGRGLDPLTVVEDSLNAWGETLKPPSTEANVEDVVGESDSELSEFFDFDE